jgi:hypothetical protein
MEDRRVFDRLDYFRHRLSERLNVTGEISGLRSPPRRARPFRRHPPGPIKQACSPRLFSESCEGSILDKSGKQAQTPSPPRGKRKKSEQDPQEMAAEKAFEKWFRTAISEQLQTIRSLLPQQPQTDDSLT